VFLKKKVVSDWWEKCSRMGTEECKVTDMKMRLLVGLICGACFSSCVAQTITIDLREKSDQVCRPGWTIGPANGSPAFTDQLTDEQIFAINMKLAKGGNGNAAFRLGQAYVEGVGVGRDPKQAIHWFEIGAITPDEKAFVAHLFTYGGCFVKDLDAAARWYTAAGRPGDFFELAQSYRLASPPQPQKAIPIYVSLLKETGHPEVRRAQMELGNLVLDGRYSAGDDAAGRALNLEWARVITQELLGQEEYKMAVDYEIGREGLPKDQKMWLRYCKRAAAYNIDLAQRFYAESIMQNEAPNHTGYDDVAWVRLGSDKQYGLRTTLQSMESGMTAEQHEAADAAYEDLVKTRELEGAYYPFDDPLRMVSADKLAKMPQDDPDVELRYAFALEAAAKSDEKAYRQAMDLYRTVRDHREMDIRFVLGRSYLSGTDGMPTDPALARHWLEEASSRGSRPAARMLRTGKDAASATAPQ
jgi:TPR repeat protein